MTVGLGVNTSETRNSREILHSYLMGSGHHRKIFKFFFLSSKNETKSLSKKKGTTYLINEMREQAGVLLARWEKKKKKCIFDENAIDFTDL